MIKKQFLLGLTLIFLFFGASTSFAVDRYIAVSATGSVKVKPDAVRINATTWAVAPNSKSALSQTSDASNNLRKALADFNINKSLIKSNSITVFPEYNYTQDKGSVLTGYKASQSFEIIIRNAANAGKIVDSIVGQVSDALTIDGVTPYISDPTVATATARADAVKRARGKAFSYAKLLNVTLGKIIYLEESGNNSPVPVMMATAKSDSGSTIVDLGTQDVIVNVSTRWAIL